MVILIYTQLDHSSFEAARLETGDLYLKMWVFSMNRECGCRVLAIHNIFLIRFLGFTVDHKLRPHLSQNELFGVDPVVHQVLIPPCKAKGTISLHYN